MDEETVTLEKGDPVSYEQNGSKIKGIITEIKQNSAMVQSEDDLQLIPLRDLKKEPE